MTDAVEAVRLPGWIDPGALSLLFVGDPHAFWLDAGPSAQAGWSYVGTGSRESDPQRVRAVVSGTGGAQRRDWPAGPFRGGWVGWITYETGAAACGVETSQADPGVPGECWIRAGEWFALDHAARTVWAVAPADRVEALVGRTSAALPARDDDAPPPREAAARHEPDEYGSLIGACRDAIREGDAYQLCLTTRFEVEGAYDPDVVFARLRAAHDAPCGGLVRCGDAALASASPESFLRVRDGVVTTSPIKGTRRRGGTADEDARLIDDLRASVKERAENVMIVDLMRNDLSRVCEAGSVGVDALFEVETHPAVHQLVSVVSGRLTAGADVGDLLTAAFPAGSMTGAPKLSAMTILHGLEGGARGVFSGCFGWVGTDGSVDLAMVIRSIVFTGARAVVGAGGGITWRSEPQAEIAEVALKARGPLAALGAGLPSGWRDVPVG